MRTLVKVWMAAGIAVCLLAWMAGPANAAHLGRFFDLRQSLNERETLYVVHTVPIFDGTGYASQQAIWYTPYGVGHAITGYRSSPDYYSIVQERY